MGLTMFRFAGPLLASDPPTPVEPDVLWANVAYLLAAVLFILGLKGLTHPRSAVRGNLLGALGMFVATAATLWVLWQLHRQSAIANAWREATGRSSLDVEVWEVPPNLLWLVLGALALGAVVGVWFAVKIQMTAMPQLVALFNGFGGLASVFVAGAALVEEGQPSIQFSVATAVAGLIGTVTFWGSLVAFGKLQELKIFKKSIRLPAGQAINALLAAGSVALCAWIVWTCRQDPSIGAASWQYVALCLLASILGVTLVLPIGGADMPVVIALLNSYSGLAAAGCGFVIENNVLIVAGSLVGASGVILTNIMCKAMNRSLAGVLFGAMEGGGVVADADEVYAGRVKAASADEVAMMCDGIGRVVIVPGYGLAVAQAQHAVRELGSLLESRGAQVEYAIHPVAGRMPGHMNVLLAEAEVPYEQLQEMDVINPTFPQTDLAIVIGANDVVNPVARTDPQSPIAGMPILDVDKAKIVVVIKRSLSPGFAGIPNPLFAADNCLMLFGDGKQVVLDLIAAIKES
jgi:NAD(P) transhydrogenase subunit beta